MKKFFGVIGNPPYQEETIGDQDSYAPQIYNYFMEEAYKVAEKVELVTPARFLFNAGSTPKSWNKKMLEDPNLKVLYFESDIKKVFPNNQITGGVAITYRDEEKDFGAIKLFTPYEELNQILKKVQTSKDFASIASIVNSAYAYHLTEDLYEDYPELRGRLSKGHDYDLKSNIFELMPEVFKETMEDDDDVQILGRLDGNRVLRWIKRKYIKPANNFEFFKIVVSGADGAAGTIGKPIPARIVGKPSVYGPSIGFTESFVTIGAFSENEAINAKKYITTRFARTLLATRKVTQAVTPGKWEFVPLQDFSSNSDIDWSQSVAEIDVQLYKKYGLSEAEIEFIKTHVKEMD